MSPCSHEKRWFLWFLRRFFIASTSSRPFIAYAVIASVPMTAMTFSAEILFARGFQRTDRQKNGMLPKYGPDASDLCIKNYVGPSSTRRVMSCGRMRYYRSPCGTSAHADSQGRERPSTDLSLHRFSKDYKARV